MTHSNNISGILSLLFECFRNMYPCHRQALYKFTKEKYQIIFSHVVSFCRLNSSILSKVPVDFFFTLLSVRNFKFSVLIAQLQEINLQ